MKKDADASGALVLGLFQAHGFDVGHIDVLDALVAAVALVGRPRAVEE